MYVYEQLGTRWQTHSEHPLNPKWYVKRQANCSAIMCASLISFNSLEYTTAHCINQTHPFETGSNVRYLAVAADLGQGWRDDS